MSAIYLPNDYVLEGVTPEGKIRIRSFERKVTVQGNTVVAINGFVATHSKNGRNVYPTEEKAVFKEMNDRQYVKINGKLALAETYGGNGEYVHELTFEQLLQHNKHLRKSYDRAMRLIRRGDTETLKELYGGCQTKEQLQKYLLGIALACPESGEKG